MRVAGDPIVRDDATVKRLLLLIGLAVSLTANIVLAAILIVGRPEPIPGYPGGLPIDSLQTTEPLPVPEFPETLTHDSVSRYLSELGTALESRNSWSSDDPEGSYLRLLWPDYASEIADACGAHWPLESFLDTTADTRFLPQVDTDTLLRFVELGSGWQFQRALIRELINRGDEPLLRSIMEERLHDAGEQGGYVYFPEPQARYIVEAGIPIEDATAVEVIRSGAGLAVPLMQHLLRVDPDRATVLAREAFASPHLLRDLSHDMQALVLLAEAGVTAAIPIAAEAASEYDRTYAIAALRVLIRSAPAGLSGDVFLDWVAAEPPESYDYDPETRRYDWIGDQG